MHLKSLKTSLQNASLQMRGVCVARPLGEQTMISKGVAVFVRSLVLSFLALSLFAPFAPASAAITPLINYQGKLLTSSSVPVASGSYQIEFTLYDAASSGNVLWTASGTTASPDPISVPVQSNGLFSILLGDIDNGQNTLEGVNWNTSSLYLGITVGSDSEMTPRKRLSSTPQAFNAEAWNGYKTATSINEGQGGEVLKLSQTSNDAASVLRTVLQLTTSGTSALLDSFLRLSDDTLGDVFTINRQGHTTTTGNLASLGNTFLGDSDADVLTISSRIASDLIPTLSDTFSLGSDSLRWNAFLGTASTTYLSANTLNVTSTLTYLNAEGTNTTTTYLSVTTLAQLPSNTTINGQSPCLADGTGCDTPTLQEVSNAGSFTTTSLTLFGGLTTSDLTATGTTSLQDFTFSHGTGTSLTLNGLFTVSSALSSLQALTFTNATGSALNLTGAFTFGNATGTSLFLSTLLTASDILATNAITINGTNVCLEDGTNCEVAPVATNFWTYDSTGDFLRPNTSTTDLVLGAGSIATSPFYFQASATSSRLYLGAFNSTGTNVVLGATTSTITNTAFQLDGNDLFVAGNIGSASSVYTNGAFIAGSGTTIFGDGFITRTGGNLTVSSSQHVLINPSSNVGIGTSTPSEKLTVVGNIQNLFGTNASTSNGGMVEAERLQVGGYPYAVAVQGRYVYVVNNSSGTLAIVDVSDPGNAEVVGSLSVGTYGVAVSGRYAYVTNVTTLSIVDISNPASPVSTGSLSLTTPFNLAVSGRYAYVTNNSVGRLSVVDVSNPASPTQTAQVATGGSPQGVAVAGRYAYVVNSASSTLSVVDISNPMQPVKVGDVSVTTDPYQVSIQGRYAYVTHADGQTFSVIDVSNSASPSVVGVAAVPGELVRLAVSGRYVYTTGYNASLTQGLLTVFDVVSSTVPTAIAQRSLAASEIQGIAISGRHAYVAESSSNTLSIIRLPSTETTAVEAHAAEVGSLGVRGSAVIGNGVTVGGGLNVGIGGIYSVGPLAVSATNTASTFGGAVSSTRGVFSSALTTIGGQLVCVANGTNCSAGSAPGFWTYNASGDFIHPATSTTDFVLGANSIATSPFYFQAQTTSSRLYLGAFNATGTNVVLGATTSTLTFTTTTVALVASSTTYGISGSSTFAVPSGVTSITIKAWGAGGGGGGDSVSGDGGAGGGGGFVLATLSVTGGESLDVLVGGGGGAGSFSSGGAGENSGDGGGGGGRTVVVRSGVTLVAAGAGGGGGGGDNSNPAAGGAGGAAGGLTGTTGGSSGASTGGGGGLQSGGGTAGTGAANGAAGSAGAGGNGGNPTVAGCTGNAAGTGGGTGVGGTGGGGTGGTGDGGTANGCAGGGGGGGGFFGGGGGGGSTVSDAGGGGGGGGSSFATSTASASSTSAGSGTAPGGIGISGYNGTAGVGGAGGTGGGDGVAGAAGLLVIEYELAETVALGTVPFQLDGNDLFVAGNIGSASSVYTNSAFIAGQGNMYYGSGFLTNYNGSLTVTSSAHILFNPSGNVGVGTSTPSEKLTVVGGIRNLFGTDTGASAGGMAEVGSLSVTGVTSIKSISIRGRYAYAVSDNTSANFNTIDVTVPTSPTAIDNIDLAGTGLLSKVAIQGRYAYTAAADPSGSDFRITDISAPATAVTVGGLNSLDSYAIAVSGRYAYVGTDSATNNFRVIDTADPTTPFTVGTVTASGTPHSIAIQGQYAYIGLATTTNSFRVIDVSNPVTSTIVGSLNLPDNVRSVAVQGRYAYVGTDTIGNDFHVIDIEDPAAPVEVASLDLAGAAYDIAVSGRYAYVASTSTAQSLVAIDISNPTAPVAVASLSLSSGARAVAVSGRYAYVGTETGSEFRVVRLPGTEVAALEAHSAEVGSLAVRTNAVIANHVSVGGGLGVEGTAQFNGSVSIFGSTTSTRGTLWVASDCLGLVGTDRIASFADGTDVKASLRCDGQLHVDNGTLLAGGDYAEYFISSDPSLEAGDVVVLDSTAATTVTKGFAAARGNTLGVVSAFPAVTGQGFLENHPSSTIVGLLGQVRTKVSTLGAPGIQVGDPLMAANGGVAVVATGPGVVIGRAQEAFPANATGTLMAFVSPYWWAGDVFITDGAGGRVLAEDLTVTAPLFSFQGRMQGDATSTPFVHTYALGVQMQSTTSSQLSIVGSMDNATSSRALLSIDDTGSMAIAGRLYPGTHDTTAQATAPIFFNGMLSAIQSSTGWSTAQEGFATRYRTKELLAPGDLVVFDPVHPGYVKKSTVYGSGAIAGVVAERAGFVAGARTDAAEGAEGVGVNDTEVTVIITGNTRVRIYQEEGAIAAGDALTASDEPGVATRSNGPGAFLGIALEAPTGPSATSIRAFIVGTSRGHSAVASSTSAGSTLGNATVLKRGFARIAVGSVSVHVDLLDIQGQPIIQASPAGDAGAWWIANVTPAGFDLMVAEPRLSDTIFSWRVDGIVEE